MVLNKVSEVIENAGLNAAEHVALWLRGQPLAAATERRSTDSDDEPRRPST